MNEIADPGDPAGAVSTWTFEQLQAYADSIHGPELETVRVVAHWRDLPTEQIGELRRHKNLTAHLEQLVNHLQPSPLHDQLHAWVQARRHLP